MESYVNDEELFWEVYIGYNSVPYPTYSMSIRTAFKRKTYKV